MNLDALNDRLQRVAERQEKNEAELDKITETVSQLCIVVERGTVQQERSNLHQVHLSEALLTFDIRLKRIESYIYDGKFETERPPGPKVQ